MRSLRQMSTEERRSYEQQQYIEMAKDSKNGIIDPKDGTLVYYVIDHGWYKHWQDFIKGKREIPRDIENKQIKNFI